MMRHVTNLTCKDAYLNMEFSPGPSWTIGKQKKILIGPLMLSHMSNLLSFIVVSSMFLAFSLNYVYIIVQLIMKYCDVTEEVNMVSTVIKSREHLFTQTMWTGETASSRITS